MQKAVDHSIVLLMTTFSIKQAGDKFFVSRSGTNNWSRPYKTLRRATQSIALKLEEEFTRRRARIQGGG